MLFWDNWVKKFSEKFSKIVIISAYGRNEISLNEKDAESFFEFLECQHKSKKFTLENRSLKFLSFLDILVKNEGNRFSTSV